MPYLSYQKGTSDKYYGDDQKEIFFPLVEIHCTKIIARPVLCIKENIECYVAPSARITLRGLITGLILRLFCTIKYDKQINGIICVVKRDNFGYNSHHNVQGILSIIKTSNSFRRIKIGCRLKSSYKYIVPQDSGFHFLHTRVSSTAPLTTFCCNEVFPITHPFELSFGFHTTEPFFIYLFCSCWYRISRTTSLIACLLIKKRNQ